MPLPTSRRREGEREREREGRREGGKEGGREREKGTGEISLFPPTSIPLPFPLPFPFHYLRICEGKREFLPLGVFVRVLALWMYTDVCAP